MTKYFYTDALAAAWMSKHFGMKFGIKLNDGSFNWNPGYLNKHYSFVTTHNDLDGFLYIHPDCLPILAPKVGDCVRKGQSFFEIIDFDYGKDGKHAIGGGKKTIRGIYREKDPTEYKIIQRKGLVFHWPESEEV